MRRNKTFRVGDIMALIDVSQAYMRTMCWALEHAGYLKLVENTGHYRDRIYRLLRNTGVKSPSVINGEVYDYNNGKFYERPKRDLKGETPRPRMAPRVLINMLGAMTVHEMTKEEICAAAGCKVTGGGTKENFSMLTKKGVMKRTEPIARRDGHMLFAVDVDMANAMRSELIVQSGVDNEYYPGQTR